MPFKKDLTIGAGVLAIVGTGLFVIAGAVERGVATAAEVVPGRRHPHDRERRP